MEIYLVRHTTPKVEKGICYGHTNLDITDSFAEELFELKKNLPTTNLKVYSSPLLRCFKLAQEINTTIILDSRLKEVNFGDWENNPWNNIPNEELNSWMENFVTEKPPNGESYVELQQRILQFFLEITQQNNKDSKIVIVSHAGPIRALLSNIQKIDLKDSFDIKIEYGQVFKLYFRNKKFNLLLK